jgi:hypothetical protein
MKYYVKGDVLSTSHDHLQNVHVFAPGENPGMQQIADGVKGSKVQVCIDLSRQQGGR